jgi:hypothetical protein
MGLSAGIVDDLELDAVRVVEEHRIVARDVVVLPWSALDRRSLASLPVRSSTTAREGQWMPDSFDYQVMLAAIVRRS